MSESPVIRHLGSLLSDLIYETEHALRALHSNDLLLAELKIRRVLELLTGRREG